MQIYNTRILLVQKGSIVNYSSGWTFSCLHSHFTVDIDFIQRILAYLVSLNCNDPKAKEIREKILP